jgi:hypothetical protein
MVSLNVSDKKLWGRAPAARQQIVTELLQQFGTIVTRKQVISFIQSTGRTLNDVTWLLNGKVFRASRGQYSLQPLVLPNGSAVASTGSGSGMSSAA